MNIINPLGFSGRINYWEMFLPFMVNPFINANTITIKIFCVLLFFVSTLANASPLSKTLDLSEKLDLKNHPTWLKLLHYERSGDTSVVLNDTFFLSPDGRIDPEAELKATINAYFIQQEESDSNQAICRFPARYYWLSHHLPLSGYRLKNTNCSALNKWGLLDSVKSVSLLLVSGYLGNPASTFGHTFLKFNSNPIDNYTALFDSTLNYGAVVPENENSLSYIVRGLFGGYKAGFSDKYFYTQDLVYSNTEFRDIWSYQIMLSDYELTLLILHVWEIVGNKFAYYFLDKNCAYRLGELIDLVIEEELINDVRLWYFPVELFHMLNSIDRDRQESGSRKLIQSIKYIPSSQRKLYSQLKLLTPDELRRLNTIIREGSHSLQTQMQGLASGRKILLLDCLLAYQQYKIIAEKPDFNRIRHEEKKQTLLSRLQLPVSTGTPFEIPEIQSPAEGSRPMALGISVGSESNKDPFLILNWSPYKKESVGKNSMQGDEFVLADLSVGFDDDRTFIDRFDLIRILNLNTASVQIEDEDYLSWELRLGVDRVDDQDKDRHDGILSFGIGYAWQLNSAATVYGMASLAGHTIATPLQLRPHVGLRFQMGSLKTWVYGGAESVNSNFEFSEIWGGKINYHINDRYAVQAEFSNETSTELSIGFCSYW
jgi:hypothetical protein